MAYLSQKQLDDFGFKSLGRDVKISDKASIYNHDQIEIGDFTRIDDFCSVSGKVTLGRNVHLAVYSHVSGGRAGVELCDFSGLAYACHVFAQSDDYSGKTLTNPTVPAEYKREIEAAVTIGRHCIIGVNSVIMPGVQIGEGTSVGAMSLVTKDADAWSIYVGSPARRVKERSKEMLALEKEYLTKNP